LADFKEIPSFKGAKNTKIDIKYIRQGKPTTQIVLDEVEIKSVPFKK
jgi:carboxyl-terminal processing protease